MTGQSWVERDTRPVDRYVMLANAFVRDAELSLPARAVGAWLLSQAPGFRFNVPTIARLNGCGEDQVKSALRALEARNYLRREQVRGEDGTITGVRYLMTDEPEECRSDPPGGNPPGATDPPIRRTTSRRPTTSGRDSAPSPPDGLFEPPPKAKKRGSRLPVGFDITPDMAAWKREHAPHVHLRNELGKFVDHWASAAGPNAVKVDWVRAWQLWMRRAEEDWQRREQQQQRPRPTGTRTRTDPTTGHMREEY